MFKANVNTMNALEFNPKVKRQVELTMLLGFIIAIAGILSYLLQYSLFYTHDTCIYLMGAENIANGNGFYSYNVLYNGENSLLAPVTHWQPSYSVAIAGISKVFGINFMQAALTVNLLFWLIMMLGWFFIIKHSIKNLFLRLLATICLIFAGYMYKYFNYGLSETLCFGLLSMVILVGQKLSESPNFGRFVAWSLTGAALMATIVLTRYAAAPFAFGFLCLILLVPGFNFRQKFTVFFISAIIILLPAVLWYWRNLSLSGTGMIELTGAPGSLFDIPRVIEIVNIFVTVTFGLVTTFEKLHFLLIIPLIVFAGYFIYNHKQNLWQQVVKHRFLVFVLLTAVVYVAGIVYAGLINRSFMRFTGFERYFAYLMPLVLFIIVYLLSHSSKSKSKINIAYRAYLSLLLLVMLVAGTHRTINILSISDQRGKSTNKGLYEAMVNEIKPNDLLFSNTPEINYFYTKIPGRFFKTRAELDSLINVHKNDNGNMYAFINGSYQKRIQPKNIEAFVQNIEGKYIWESENIVLLKLKK